MKFFNSLVLIFLVNIGFGQLLPNSSFEFPSPSLKPDNRSQVEELIFWYDDSRIITNTHHYHSPDWYMFDQYHIEEDYGNGYIPVLGENSTSGYVGMYECELIKQRIPIPLNRNDEYQISFKFRIPNNSARVNQQPSRSFGSNGLLRGSLIFLFSKNDVTYKNDYDCDLENVFLSDFESFLINGYGQENFFPGQWYTGWKKFIAQADYDHISVYFEPVENGDASSEYILLDEIQLFETCSNIECDFKDGPIKAYLGSNVYGLNPSTGLSSVFTLEDISNVQDIEVNILPINQAIPVFSGQISCTNGFAGKVEILNSNTTNLAAGSYIFEAILTNQNCRKEIRSQVKIFLDNETFPNNFNYSCNSDNLLEPCCEGDINTNEEVYLSNVGVLTVQPINNLYIQNTTINPGTAIDFKAGNKIEVTQNTILGGEGNVRLFLENCNEERRTPINSTPIQQSITEDELFFENEISPNEILIYPNPTNATFFIQNIKEQFNLKIYTSRGVMVKSFVLQPNQKIEISTEGWSKGLFYLNFSNPNGLSINHKVVVY